MTHFKKYFFTCLICLLAAGWAGCEKPGSISLVGPDAPVIVPPTTKSLLTTDDIDPVGFFAPIDAQGYGQLLIEGSTYDSPTVHHTASVARAVFFDATHPVQIGGDTEFLTLNIGSMKIGQLTLNQVPKKYIGGAGDTTVLGTQYLLLNQDGAGGGFTYGGSQVYTWQGLGSQTIPAFQVAVSGPQSLVVTSPSAHAIVRLSSSLSVKWTGGADTVRLYVRLMENGVPTKQLFQLKQQNRGGILVPRDLLNVLPHDQTQFMFTFTSSKTSRVKVAGIAGDVVVQAVTTHNLVLQVRP